MDKRLYRSRKESMIAGVAGGLAEYFSIDPVLIRILFVVAVFLHGIGLFAYIVLWIVVPHQPAEYETAEGAEGPDAAGADTPSQTPDGNNGDAARRRASFGGYILIGIGMIFLADNLIPSFHIGEYWPVILIALGFGLLYNATKTKREKE